MDEESRTAVLATNRRAAQIFSEIADASDFETFYNEFGDKVRAQCNWVLGTFNLRNREDKVDDLTQEVLLKLWKSKSTLHTNQESFWGWVQTIARNTLISLYRKEKKSRIVTMQVGDIEESSAVRAKPFIQWNGTSQIDTLIKKERDEGLHKLISSLPKKFRQPILLRDIENLSYQEITEQLGLKEGTVKSRLNRGRVLLAKKAQYLE